MISPGNMASTPATTMKVSAKPERRLAAIAKTIAVDARSERPTRDASPCAHEADRDFSPFVDTRVHRHQRKAS